MLRGAMDELAVGDPRLLATDVGPVIDAEARDKLADHIGRWRARDARIYALPLPRSAPTARSWRRR
jgi:RHH-type proline utilization regulon transcriptional repressor/proline dehydrogenase/delta 1-pyrroline-5-carboxylate dehydrogenase